MSERYDRYDGWAWLYNRTMGPKYGEEQLALLHRVLLPNLSNDAHILDLCCGTGQLIQPLLENGYQVTGLDGSEDMLKHARENAPGANFLLEDARQFNNKEIFDAVFSTSASLNHIESLTDLKKVLVNVFNALTKNGIFLFDLNHNDQLAKWWRGYATEGEIGPDYAWIVTPYYEEKNRSGKFTVAISHSNNSSSNLGTRLRWPIYRLLNRPRFIGLRLKLLKSFSRIESKWKHEVMDFPVYGHDIDSVVKLLSEVGFDSVRVETIDGDALDANHSAHFICTKPAEVSA